MHLSLQICSRKSITFKNKQTTKSNPSLNVWYCIKEQESAAEPHFPRESLSKLEPGVFLQTTTKWSMDHNLRTSALEKVWTQLGQLLKPHDTKCFLIWNPEKFDWISPMTNLDLFELKTRGGNLWAHTIHNRRNCAHETWQTETTILFTNLMWSS